MFADDHAFVEGITGAYEQTAALLNLPERIGNGVTVILADDRARAAFTDLTLLDGTVVVKDVAHDARAAAHRHEHRLKADEASGRNTVFQTHTALTVGLHILQIALAAAEFFHDGALMLFFDVHREKLIGFLLFAVNHFEQYARTAHSKFVAFAAHVFKQDREVQFTASAHFPDRFVRGRPQTHGDVTLQFTFQTFTNLTRGDELTFAARQGRGVHHEVHGKRRFVDFKHRKGFRGRGVGDRRTDVEVFNTVHEHDVACLREVHNLTVKTFKLQNLIDLGGLGGVLRPVHDHNVLTGFENTAVHTADTDFAHVARVVQRADLKLQGRFGVVFTHGDVLNHRVKDRAHVADLLELFDGVSRAGIAVKRRGVDHRKVELIFGSAELVEQIKCLVKDPVRTSARAVDFIDDDDGLKPLCECLAGNETRLRHRAFNGINEQQYAVNHREHALDFTAEVRVPRGIDDVDVHAFVFDGAVFRQNRDAAFLFDVTAVHHALIDLLVAAEGSRALQQLVNHRGLTVVNVSNDCNIANSSCHFVCLPEFVPLQDGSLSVFLINRYG